MKCPDAEPTAGGTPASANDRAPVELTAEMFCKGLNAGRMFMQNIARSIVGIEDAAEVIDEAVLLAWKRRKTFRGQSTVQTWLCACVKNYSVLHLRKKQCRPQRPVNPIDEEFKLKWLVDESQDVFEQTYLAELRRLIADAIQRLSDSERRGLTLWLSGGATQDGTEKCQAHRARENVINYVRSKLGLARRKHPGVDQRAGAGTQGSEDFPHFRKGFGTDRAAC